MFEKRRVLMMAVSAASGFWSLLPVGQGETVDATGVSAFLGAGTVPASFESQRGLFEALPAAAPNIATADLGKYLKPAPIEPAAADVVSTESPRAGVVIRRDAHHVPYVTGVTRSDVMWGAGWVAGEDRLFAMDAVRLLARGRLTELIGPGPDGAVAREDAAQLGVTDYRPDELIEQVERLRNSGADGFAVVTGLEEYVRGINAYIDHAFEDPSAMPGEYAALGRTPKKWSTSDIVSVAGLVTGYFGRGGGVELDDALAYAEARKRFGRRRGDATIADFRAFDDPEAPVTTTRRFPFDDPGPPRDAAVAIPDPGSVELIDRIRGEGSGGTGGRGAPGWLTRMRAVGGLGLTPHASNATAITAKRSASGNPLLFGNPQVDFYAPPLFHEVALKGPGIEARGAALAGLGPAVLIGRGPDYAWTITTAQGDNIDTFAERLCEPGGERPTTASMHYRYRGKCVPLETYDDEVSWSPGPADLLGGAATPYRATFHTERSVHGPIIARATVRGAPVAYSFARSTYHHEFESAAGLLALNTGPGGAAAFQRAAGSITGSFNVIYADRKNIAYVQSGLYPRRARGVHPDLPAWGTGAYDWRGFRPGPYTARMLPYARLPKEIDPKRGYFISWNNKQAPGWRTSDYDWQYGPVHRSQRLEKRVRRALARGGKLDLGRLVGIAGDAGTVDVRGQEVLPWLLRVLGKDAPADLAPAVAELRGWAATGAHRRDADGDGFYERAGAVALMDAWFTPLAKAIFRPVLGTKLIDRIAKINQVDYTPKDGPDTWFYGWMGYVQRDMRGVLGRRIARPPSRVYCGRGRPAACRAVLHRTLRAAVSQVTKAHGSLEAVRVPATCPVTEPATCDQLDFIPAGAIELAPTPWQDRGSFQIAAEVGAVHGG